MRQPGPAALGCGHMYCPAASSSSAGATEDEVAPGAPITIVIADDHQVVRAGLRLLLDAAEGFEVLA